MASFFTSKQQQWKPVPNGGLGGVGYSGEVTIRREGDNMSPTYRPQQRRELPPILTSSSSRDMPMTPSQWSALSALGFDGPWTPNTNDGVWSGVFIGEEKKVMSSLLVSRYNSAIPSKSHHSLPETPGSVNSELDSNPAELPGSLLLASQGFPQSEPITPPPSLRLVRRDTEESNISSAPTLSTSTSSDDIDMEALRSLTTPLRRNDRPGENAMPTYTISNRNPHDAHISKPFSAMDIEELLQQLPRCNALTTNQLWLPAMRTQIQNMAQLLHDAGEMKIESSVNEVVLNEDLTAFSDDMRRITTSYRKIVESAESLAERDSKVCQERLRLLEDQVEDALEMIETKDKAVEDQGRDIHALKHTILEIVRILGTFIQNNVASWADTINEPRNQEVLQLISDYTRPGDNKSIRYVRIPDAAMSKYVKDIQDSKALVKQYREVLHGQVTMIKEQSENLDVYADKYEAALRVGKQRDHEIVLLAQQNEELKMQLEDARSTLARNKEANLDAEAMAQRYEELRSNMNSLKIAHELEVDQRDAEIANLRQKLGSAREEVFARREDVRNIISQTRSMLPNPTISEPPGKSSHASKALRFLGMEKDKFKRGALPVSRSMMAFAPPNVDNGPLSADSRFSSKELARPIGRPALHQVASDGPQVYSQTTPSTPFEDGRASSATTLPIVRPRSDSMSAMQRHGAPSPPVDTQKSLPAPPGRPQAQRLSTAQIAEITESIQSPTAAQVATDYFKNSILGQTAARRVLSNIPEGASRIPAESSARNLDEVYEDGDSVASSDREVFRRSICALDMLNSSTLPHSETETDMDRYVRGVRRMTGGAHRELNNDSEPETQTGVARILHLRPGTNDLRGALRTQGRDFGREERVRQSVVSDGSGYQTSDSEPMSVTQLYHQGGRHIRG
ncbi:hypothetical protein EDD37DRAFT_607143 [Exophiala viscosa]|uniref:uncharacterized protein n=1 Tax=Exophiala viscosa TaxID=2486360 RepID=UPI002195D2A8|nr:hypothetical protein EDD37DRAFT_607143 [Exophiala viscosa]